MWTPWGRCDGAGTSWVNPGLLGWRSRRWGRAGAWTWVWRPPRGRGVRVDAAGRARWMGETTDESVRSRAQTIVEAAAADGTRDAAAAAADGVVAAAVVAAADFNGGKITVVRRSDGGKIAAAVVGGVGTPAARGFAERKTHSRSKKPTKKRPRRTIPIRRRRRYSPVRTVVWTLTYTRTFPWRRAGETSRNPSGTLPTSIWEPR